MHQNNNSTCFCSYNVPLFNMSSHGLFILFALQQCSFEHKTCHSENDCKRFGTVILIFTET